VIRRCFIPSTRPTQLHFFREFLGNVSATKVTKLQNAKKYLLRANWQKIPRKPKLTRNEAHRAQNFAMGAL
jgi:hypothetical protein